MILNRERESLTGQGETRAWSAYVGCFWLVHWQFLFSTWSFEHPSFSKADFEVRLERQQFLSCCFQSSSLLWAVAREKNVLGDDACRSDAILYRERLQISHVRKRFERIERSLGNHRLPLCWKNTHTMSSSREWKIKKKRRNPNSRMIFFLLFGWQRKYECASLYLIRLATAVAAPNAWKEDFWDPKISF